MFPSEGQCDKNTTYDEDLDRIINWPVTMAGTTVDSFERCTLMTKNGMFGES